ncbi:YbcC family protein [Lacipirellula limnantheis]|uniref:Probable inorganic carbon transporter subunit DabA n=1 Tax=Lacipirellula limnantheis TaxID=2528024 RepID=A0A517TUJ3_9BACT|nr:DUF2309 domain-containing protein [Lacipirellula limnantheis]QDT72042.1 hypothetical protein I41_12080 [Lacipirellula limnantheis]
MVAASLAQRAKGFPATPTNKAPDIEQVLVEVQAAIVPLWPLKDFVAVNPLGGMSDADLLQVHRTMRRQRDAELLMPGDYYLDSLARGSLADHDLEAALNECRVAHPEIYGVVSVSELATRLEQHSSGRTPQAEPGDWTFAAAIDRGAGTSWSASVVAEISKICAAHFDQTQATWPSPWKHLSFYAAWREMACRDRRIEKLGLADFRVFAAQLPASPREAIEALLRKLDVGPSQWQAFLLSQLWSINGWSAYVKYRVRTAAMAGVQDEDLLGLLAARLAYDAALAEAFAEHSAKESWLPRFTPSEEVAVGDEASARYFFQAASEVAFRRSICRELLDANVASGKRSARPEVQMVFCIDVRSEPIRRRLENAAKNLETFGYAGFFGVPMEYVPLGARQGPCQCPALISPSISIKEGLGGGHEPTEAAILSRRLSVRLSRKVWKAFQSSASSCFSFVEAVGLAYAGKLLAASVGWRSSNGDGRYDGVSDAHCQALGPVIDGMSAEESEKLVNFAAGMLGATGWTSDFAPLVVVCGHESDATNNLYKAALDCGACGGHSGEANARAAAAILNDARVRRSLAARGIEIPADSYVLAAVHNTTTDEIRWLDSDNVPATHAAALSALRHTATKAAREVQAERAQRFGIRGDARRRARDWSEVRPEWGLAGNAAFIIAPRSSTAEIDLKGRVFLHSYDHDQDAELRALESIMTGPMVVTNWINMQYYASTVDNRAFGSGNKTIHNAVGNIGVVAGNGGDLMTGLAWQSVHDGRRLQHEPLRLLVIVQAPRQALESVIAKHETLRALAGNQWITLLAWERGKFFRYVSAGQWQAYAP